MRRGSRTHIGRAGGLPSCIGCQRPNVKAEGAKTQTYKRGTVPRDMDSFLKERKAERNIGGSVPYGSLSIREFM